METITNQPVQTEVSLRTLSSDLKSIEHGEVAPTATVLKITSQTQEEVSVSLPQDKKTGRTVLMVIILLAILAIGYFYIYPSLMAAI